MSVVWNRRGAEYTQYTLTHRSIAAGSEEESQGREAKEASGGQQAQDDWLNSECGDAVLSEAWAGAA